MATSASMAISSSMAMIAGITSTTNAATTTIAVIDSRLASRDVTGSGGERRDYLFRKKLTQQAYLLSPARSKLWIAVAACAA